MLGARERLRARFHRLAVELGYSYEVEGKWENAIRVYRDAIELDNLAEELYRRLMACYLRIGQRSEVAEVYRRCRQQLSVVLGVAPAASTEALRRQAG
jgi:DNA-binding SARP family transcriptional activator